MVAFSVALTKKNVFFFAGNIFILTFILATTTTANAYNYATYNNHGQ